VNLANLLLARTERRARDAAVRIALGASSGQLVRQALAETMLLALIGGGLGVTVAAASLGAFIRSAPVDIPRLDEVRLDPWVLLFGFTIAAGTGLLFGLAPAWRAARVHPEEALKAGGRTIGGGATGARLRAGLVTAEVGLSVVLLTTAALLIFSFARLVGAEKGFRAPAVLAGQVQIPWEKYKEKEQRSAFHERVLERLDAQPGVVSAAIVTALPLTGETWIDSISVPGDKRPEMERPMVNVRFASADYFRTMGIPLLAGRTFSVRDRHRDVAVISERVAQALWPGENAVGRQFVTNNTNREVIGVVGDVLAEPHKPAVSIVYRPYWDWAPQRVELVARAAGDPRSIAGAMRAAVRSVDPDVPSPELHTMQQVLAESLAQRRFQMLLIAAFAGTALLLAALGIYGMVSYSVTRRRNELGVRMALGARSADLYVMLMRQTMQPVVVGLVAGVLGSLAGERVLASLLYEVRPGDPRIIAAVAGLLLTVALAACFVPARRSARVSPLEALRHE
ncbi:MAG TPA: FtsX-like permease family protein, partial [Bryobacteraceae bacterium]